MDAIAQDIRRGLVWVVLPLALASAVRLGLEPDYWSVRFVCWLLLIPGYAIIQSLALRQAGPWRIRLAVLLNFGAISVGYQMIGVALRSSGGWRADDLVYRGDCWIFRGDPQRFLAHLQAPWLSTITMAGYLAFGGYLVYLFLAETFILTAATGRLQLGLMRLYGLGFAGYLLLPAAGPAFHHPGLLHPISHSSFSARLQPWVLGNCSRVDVCPSIHAAVCCFMLIWTYQHHRRLFPYLVLPSAALLLGTVYLQYHYVIDVPFGLLLGAGAAYSVSHALPPPILSSPGSAG
jgi:PAP2 superfamily